MGPISTKLTNGVQRHFMKRLEEVVIKKIFEEENFLDKTQLIHLDDEEMTNFFIKNGAKVNVSIGFDETTPLHMAVKNGKLAGFNQATQMNGTMCFKTQVF